MDADIINSIFEFCGGLFQCLSIRRILIDKKARGLSVVGISFFFLWGCWNLYYYPHLDQWYSFVAGVFIAITNIIWISLIIRYEGWKVFKKF